MRTVGRVLRHLRRAALLTLDDAAVAVSISPARLRALEAGESLPDCFETADLGKAYLMTAAGLSAHLRLARNHEAAMDVARRLPSDASTSTDELTDGLEAVAVEDPDDAAA